MSLSSFWRPFSLLSVSLLTGFSVYGVAAPVMLFWGYSLSALAGECLRTLFPAIIFGLAFWAYLRSALLAALATVALLCVVFDVELVFRCMSALWNSRSHLGWTELNVYVSDIARSVMTVGVGVVVWELRTVATEVCHGATAPQAARKSLRKSLAVGMIVFFIAVGVTLLPLLRELAAETSKERMSFELLAIAGVVVSILSIALLVFVAMPLVVSYLPFDEAFIARTNRLRERYQRFLQSFEGITEPRWALAGTGIAAVLFALVFFDRIGKGGGGHQLGLLKVWSFGGTALGISLVLIAGVLLARLRDWRMVAAFALAVFYSATLAVWFAWHAGLMRVGDLPAQALRLDGPMDYPAWESIAPCCAWIACLCLLLADAAIPILRTGETLAVAVRSAALETGDGLLFMAAVFTAACAFSPFVFVPISGAAGALVLFPLLCVSMETLFPRYRTVDEVFGKR